MEQINKWKWSQFGNLRTCEDLEEYIKGREQNHTGYFHYTNINAIDSILMNNEFWLSHYRTFNDRADQEQFKSLGCFSICFSTGKNENLPLWYFYSGLDGLGGRIEFTKAGIKNLIHDSKFYLVKMVNKGQYDIKTELVESQNMNIIFRDVIYSSPPIDDNENYSLKYNTMTNYFISKQEFERYRVNHIGFNKSLFWYYEKETRLLVQLNAELENLLHEDENNITSYKVVLRFDDKILKNIKIRLAPNFADEDKTTELKDKKGFQKWIRMTSKLQLSEYHGTVLFNFCSRCEKKRGKKFLIKHRKSKKPLKGN